MNGISSVWKKLFWKIFLKTIYIFHNYLIGKVIINYSLLFMQHFVRYQGFRYLFEKEVWSVTDGLWQTDPVAHVGDGSEGVHQGSVGTAHSPVVGVHGSAPIGPAHLSGKVSNSINFICSHLLSRKGAGSQILGVPDRGKNIDLPEGQINEPSSGKFFSLLFLPTSPSSPSWTLKRAFWLALWLAFCIASGATEIPGHCQVCHASCRGPTTPSRTTGANLDCAFV